MGDDRQYLDDPRENLNLTSIGRCSCLNAPLDLAEVMAKPDLDKQRKELHETLPDKRVEVPTYYVQHHCHPLQRGKEIPPP